MYSYNTFGSPNMNCLSPFKFQVFGRKPRTLVDLETDPNIEVYYTYNENYDLLNKRLQHIQRLLLLFDFKMKKLAMLNMGREFFHYKSGDLVYIISLLTSQPRAFYKKFL